MEDKEIDSEANEASRIENIFDSIHGFRNYNAEEHPYRIPYEGEYRRVVTKFLKKDGIDEDTIEKTLNDPASLSYGGSSLGLDPLFENVFRKKTKKGKADQGEEKNNLYDLFGDHKYFVWHHRHDHHIQSDVEKDDIEIWSYEFRPAVASYIKKPEIQDDWLDWYCADVLCYREYVESLKQAGILTGGIFSTLLIRFGGVWGKVAGYALRIAMFFIKWAIWLGILFAIMTLEKEWTYILSISFLALTAFVQYRKIKGRQKLAELLASMERAYATLESTTFSWEVFWKQLDESRKLGAVWPGELWKLVELRKTQG